jgi:hypothetical protein
VIYKSQFCAFSRSIYKKGSTSCAGHIVIIHAGMAGCGLASKTEAKTAGLAGCFRLSRLPATFFSLLLSVLQQTRSTKASTTGATGFLLYTS